MIPSSVVKPLQDVQRTILLLIKVESLMKMSQTTPNFQWVRPVDVVPYPNVWQEFECKESKNSDKLVKYRIQDLPEDRFDDAIKHLMENYLPDEPISVACDGINNKDYVDDYERMWRGALEQKATLVCFCEGSDEIVGLSVLVVNTKSDPFLGEIVEQSKSTEFRNLLKIFDVCYASFTPYEKYGVTQYIGSLGLSVDRKYRGMALGTRLLKARSMFASPFGLKITHTLFLSDHSNNNADKAGFQLDIAITFDELNRINPDFQFKNMPGKGVAIKTLIF